MAARARDDPQTTDTANKDKENRPLSPAKSRQSLIPSLIKSPERLEFFTDSYLGNSDASQSSAPSSSGSRLPTLKTKPKPKRSKQSIDDGSSRSKHRNAQSESQIPRPREIRVIHKRQTTALSPARSIGLSTPPRSHDGISLASPVSTFSSPPRALTDTYERILQEEDLAATEGQISDPESLPAHAEEAILLKDHIKGLAEEPSHKPSSPSQSRTTTPTQQIRDHRTLLLRQDDDLTTASIKSDPTGTSFWRNLSDRKLAEAMTPLVEQSSEDRQVLKEVWAKKRLQAFPKAGPVHTSPKVFDQAVLATALPSRRLQAFTKAYRVKLDSDYLMRPSHQRTFSDVAQQVTRSQDDLAMPRPTTNWHDEHVTQDVMPHNPRLHKPPYFSRVHGFPQRGVVRQDDYNTSPKNSHKMTTVHSGFPSTHHVPVKDSPPTHQNTLRPPRSPVLNGSTHLNRSDRKQQHKHLHQYDSDSDQAFTSDINWAEAAGTEIDHPNTKQPLSSGGFLRETPQSSRRLDVDFTGKSFQVSDSPSVRVKSSPHEYFKRREIEGIAKQAVATNRLSQIRAHESQENLRKASGSPIQDLTADHVALHGESPARHSAERLSTTPATLHRSPSDGSSRSLPAPKIRLSPDHVDSHDLLQRLARGSSTPGSSSSATTKIGSANGLTQQDNGLNQVLNAPSVPTPSEEGLIDQAVAVSKSVYKPLVQETPRPVGAWTDTVLPDTRKTLRRDSRLPYAETPHINAGGWVDTPAPHGQLARLGCVPEVTTEIPQDLMDGIGCNKAVTNSVTHVASIQSGHDDGKDSSNASGETVQPGVVLHKPYETIVPPQARSITQKVLIDMMGKSVAADGREFLQFVNDDTSQLNPSTLQSIQNVLDANTEDLTSLSRLNADRTALDQDETMNTITSLSDTQVLSRLSAKIDKVMLTMQDARRGITHLVEQVASSEPGKIYDVKPSVLQPENKQIIDCVSSSIMIDQGTTKGANAKGMPSPGLPNAIFPTGTAIFTLPIPLLWRSARKNLNERFARPTVLGWVLISLWCWYILETTLSELYSHPLYASSYTWPDRPEPEFPLVLPTMLWRWSQLGILYPYTIQPIVGILTALLKMLAMIFNVTDGFVDQSPLRNNKIAGETLSAVIQEATGMAEDLHMNLMNDEFL